MTKIKIVNMHTWVEPVDGVKMLIRLEAYGRTCYKSEPPEEASLASAIKFITMILKRGHESVIEHEKVTAKIVCDRGISHELVRHRIASYSQESTRYCDYGDKPIEFIDPRPHIPESEFRIWEQAMRASAKSYNWLREQKVSPQMARSVLPNSLKTEIVMTMNLRAWRHFFKMRTAKEAHPQMQDVAKELLDKMHKAVPTVFSSLVEIKI